MPAVRPGGHRRTRLLLTITTSVAVVVVVFAFVLPSVATYGAAWGQVRAMSPLVIVLLLAATALNVATYVGPWLAAIPGLAWRRSFELTMATTALASVIPLGGAFAVGAGYGMLREWGWSRQEATRGTLITGLATQVLNVGFPVIALTLLTISGEDGGIYSRLLPWAVVILAFALLPLLLTMASDRSAHWVGEGWQRLATPLIRSRAGAGQATDGAAFVRFRNQSVALLRRRWLAILWTNVANLMSAWLVLALALHGVGISTQDVGWREGFAAFALSRLLVAIPLTPGGLGIVELGLTGALTRFGGEEAAVVAAVLVYRALTLVPMILAGAVAAFTWRRGIPASASASASDHGLAVTAQEPDQLTTT